MNNNKDSLRKQIIDAIKCFDTREGQFKPALEDGYITNLFDEAVMPVLDAAMKAGELLLHRATTPQKPVPEAIVNWLEETVACIGKVLDAKPVPTQHELTMLLIQLEGSAKTALADAKAITNQQGSEGMPPDGQTPIPMKG